MVYSRLFNPGIVIVLALLTGCSTVSDTWDKVWHGAVALEGSQEVPPVTTSASGKSTITVKEDRTVSGSVTFSGFTATAAHIHMAAAGKNGPVILPLKKTSATEFVVPEGAKLTEAQYTAFKAGNLYVNVHSAARPAGEIRAQLKP